MIFCFDECNTVVQTNITAYQGTWVLQHCGDFSDNYPNFAEFHGIEPRSDLSVQHYLCETGDEVSNHALINLFITEFNYVPKQLPCFLKFCDNLD